MINLPFGYWAAEVTQRRMLRWMMEHAHFKIDSDLRQKKEALWAIETPHQKTCNFITEPFWGRCVLLSLPSWNIHELPFSHCLKSPFHNTRKIILFCYKTVVSSHLEYSMKFWHFTSKEGKHQWKSFKWSSGLD